MPSNKKNSAFILILGGVAASVGLIMLLRYLKSNKSVKSDNVTNPDKISTTSSSGSSSFPLKKGSKGNLVKELQLAIGTAADGDFGPKTEAALKAATGKISVDTQSELDTIISKAKTSASASADVANESLKAAALIANWTANTNLKLMLTKALASAIVTIDYTGNTIGTGEYQTFNKNQVLSRDYKPVGIAKNGMLIVNGPIAGMTSLLKANYLLKPSLTTLT